MTSSQNVDVCSNGAGFVKCGSTGNNFITSNYPCMAEQRLLRYEESLGKQELEGRVIEDACSQFLQRLEVAYPISNGTVQSRDDTGDIWDLKFFNSLQIDPAETKMLLADPQRNHEKMLQHFCSVVHSNASCSHITRTR